MALVPGVGELVHVVDSRKGCLGATVISTNVRINIQVGEDSEGKPKYEGRAGIEVEVIDNGGRYNRTLLHRDQAGARSDSFHSLDECKK